MINIGIGLAWKIKDKAQNVVLGLINNFKSRVAADTGTFEAESCLNATLTQLNNIQ